MNDRIRELQEALDQVAAQVTEEYLVPALAKAGVENPERYTLRYVLDERPEPVQGILVTLTPEQRARRSRALEHLARARGILEGTGDE